jgi:hypothetical protein
MYNFQEDFTTAPKDGLEVISRSVWEEKMFYSLFWHDEKELFINTANNDEHTIEDLNDAGLTFLQRDSAPEYSTFYKDEFEE